MKNDPLAVLVKTFTPADRENERLRRVQSANRHKKHMKPRIPVSLAILWCEWNRGAAEVSDLAYAFGQHFSRECLKEWNKLTPEEIDRNLLKKKETRRIRYNSYMREYYAKHRKSKKQSLPEKEEGN